MLPILPLTDAFKGYTYDQDKLLTPEETIRRVRERLAGLDLEILAGDHAHRFRAPGHPGLSSASWGPTPGGWCPPRNRWAKAPPRCSPRPAPSWNWWSASASSPLSRRAPSAIGRARDLEGQALPFSYLARSLFDASPDVAAAAALYQDWPLHFVPATNLTPGPRSICPCTGSTSSRSTTARRPATATRRRCSRPCARWWSATWARSSPGSAGPPRPSTRSR